MLKSVRLRICPFKMNNQPLVSIVLPVYNCVKYLQTCLDSLLSQSYANIEIIAIDDKSKDGSFQILLNAKKKDKRVKLTRNKKHYGLAVCFNRALRLAQGQLITFMDPKDVTNKKRVERQVDFLNNNPKTVAVGAQCKYVDKNNNYLGESQFPRASSAIVRSLIPGFSIQFETVMVNRLLLPKDIIYFQTNRYPFIFSDVFVKFFRYGEFANLKEYLHTKRKTVKNTYSKLSHFVSTAKLFVKSVMLHDYRPPLQTLLTPLKTTNT